MENASKALLIAGSVLIGILLLTLFVYLYTQLSENASNVYSTIDHAEISKFNQKFLNYKGRGIDIIGHDDSGTPITNPLTIQDVVTIVNMAKDNNKEQRKQVTINVKVDGSEWTTKTNLENEILNNLENKYKCNEVNIDPETELVNSVEIQKITP